MLALEGDRDAGPLSRGNRRDHGILAMRGRPTGGIGRCRSMGGHGASRFRKPLGQFLEFRRQHRKIPCAIKAGADFISQFRLRNIRNGPPGRLAMGGGVARLKWKPAQPSVGAETLSRKEKGTDDR